ncbi:MAG: hypothetical protein GC166_04455 [Alphaproteobacteria bacterium]|nr:hypothetical protein [Alphaproteobacteria bacterium]
MPEDTREARWPSIAPAGGKLEWVERDGVFVGVDSGAGMHFFDDLDIEHLLPNACATASCTRSKSSNILPNDFRHCPDCGTAATPIFGCNDRLWSFPGPDGDGLLNAESVTIHRVSVPIDGGLPAPEARGLTFFVAGTPPRLMAIERNTSTVYVFNRQTRNWRGIVVERDFDSGLPDWSWSIHAFRNGFALAGAHAPLIATLDTTGTDLKFSSPPHVSGGLVSGAAGVERFIFFLHRHGETGLEILVYDTRSGEWTLRAPVTNTPGGLPDDLAFAAHVWKDPTLFWASPYGYVAMRVARNGVEAEWRTWASEFKPQLAIRPLWAQQGFWQFGNWDGQRLLFQCLAFKGGHRLNEVFATHLTAGECTFTSGMKRYAVPWDESTAQTLGRGDSFLMPICGIAGLGALIADCGFDPNLNRVNPYELLEPNAPLKPAKLLVLQNDGRLLDLNRTMRVGSLTQLQCIVFGGQLLVYDRESGIIEAWDIE